MPRDLAVEWLKSAIKDAEKVLPQNAARAQLQLLVERLRFLQTEGFNADLPLKRLQGKFRKLSELRVKGGALGKSNIRVFFSVIENRVVILGVTKKEKEGALNYVYETMLQRLEDYEL